MSIPTIDAVLQNPRYTQFDGALIAYKREIKLELQNKCQEIINMIKTDAMKSISDIDNQAFFLKMIGDYYRYMGESAKGEVLKMARDGALKHYQEAQTAVEGLHACNSVKLGIALNLSVFYYKDMDDFKQACEIAE